MNFIRSAVALLFAGTMALPAWAARPDLLPVPGEVIVQFKADAAVLRKRVLSAPGAAPGVRSALAERAATLGARIGRTLEAGPAVGERMQVMRGRGIDATALAARLAADPEIEFAVPNGRQRRLGAPNDPLYLGAPPVDLVAQRGGPASGQWYLRAPTAEAVSAIGIEAAWARTRGSAGVVVALLDTGVRFEHPDLGRVANGGSLLPGYDFVSDSVIANDGDGRDGDPSDPGDWVTGAESLTSRFSDCGTAASSWHGTSTASLVGAATDNGLGMAGSAPGVRVLPVRVLGKCYGTDADIQAAMLWAAGLPVEGVPDNPHPARVINMSLGSGGACNAAYQSVVDRITAAGVVIVAAAGNSTGAAVGTPGNCRGVIAVLALRHVGAKVGFSDLGPEIAIAAPGGNCINITVGSPCLYPIVSATNSGLLGPETDGWTDSFNISVGTSFSSPLVAGIVGLMVSQQPALTPAQVRSALQGTARPFPTSGADNGPDDPTPVAQCRPPSSDVEQLQCYCTTGLCGAGMVDAGAAVAAVAGALARIDIGESEPTAGSAVTLSGSASLAAPGATIAGFAWTLLDGGGIVSGFGSATNAAVATLLPGAAGTFTVRLTVTDSLGGTSSVDRTVVVAAAPEVAPPPESGGGGGLVSAPWVAGLVLAAVVLMRLPRRRHPKAARKA
ncbi:MAG: S8 family serine peptidase [Rubrivivax sp.]|nr:S8 family serine peptidase [Rubrivivax sp.]